MQTSNSAYNFQQNSDASNHCLEAAAHLDRLWLRAQSTLFRKGEAHPLSSFRPYKGEIFVHNTRVSDALPPLEYEHKSHY